MKRAQVWGLDVMMGFALFLVAMMIFFAYSINYSSESTETFELLTYDGNLIAQSILSQGYPENWDPSNVEKIGLTDENKINQTKLENFYYLISNGNYSKTKRMFNTNYDYYIFFENNMTINSSSVEGIGYPGATKNSIQARDLTKITRITFYENKTVPIYIYIWQ
jgi:hypothetical protein